MTSIAERYRTEADLAELLRLSDIAASLDQTGAPLAWARAEAKLVAALAEAGAAEDRVDLLAEAAIRGMDAINTRPLPAELRGVFADAARSALRAMVAIDGRGRRRRKG